MEFNSKIFIYSGKKRPGIFHLLFDRPTIAV
jgi:hypothetical protein